MIGTGVTIITKLNINMCNSTLGNNVHTCNIELTIEIFFEAVATTTSDGSSSFCLNTKATIQPKEYPSKGKSDPHKRN